MRTGCALATVGFALAACGSSVAAASAQCGPRGAQTLASDRSARVYTVGRSVYGCAAGGRHSYLLGSRPARPGQARVGPVALAGVDVAYGVTRSEVDTISAQVVVRRLDDGRTVHDTNATTRALGPEFFESVGAVVVKADGAVAWIATGGSIIRQGRETELDRIDSRGEATLDTGSGIETSSLRLRGSRLSWRHSGASRSATLR